MQKSLLRRGGKSFTPEGQLLTGGFMSKKQQPLPSKRFSPLAKIVKGARFLDAILAVAWLGMAYFSESTGAMLFWLAASAFCAATAIKSPVDWMISLGMRLAAPSKRS